MDVINKEKILEHAKKLTNEGKFDRAISEYEQLLKIDPEDLRVKIKIAELFIKRKQIPEAIKIYEEVAKKYSEGGFYLKAVTVYRNILRLNPALLEINKTLAELYEKMGLVQDSLYQYQIVASSLEQNNDIQGLMEVREKMASLSPSENSLKFRLAETYQLQGMTEKAIEVYESLAEEMEGSTHSEQLMEIYSKIFSYKPERSDLFKAICKMHWNRGEWKEILRKMENAKEIVANDEELLHMQAETYARLNQLETAKSKFRDLIDLYMDKKELEKAISVFEEILYWDPDDEENVMEESEALKPGSFEMIKANVEERRKRGIEAEKEKQETVVGKDEITIDLDERKRKPVGEVKVAEIRLGKTGIAKVAKEANASYDLGVAYKKMGLDDEAESEFNKARKIYEEIVAAGSADPEIFVRLEELKKGEVIKESPKVKAQSIKVEVKKEETKQETKKEKPKTATKEEKPISEKKKRISFV